VSKALGHANVHITLTTYVHAIPKERQGAADALARSASEWKQNGNTGLKSGIHLRQNVAQVGDNI
jgi:hypothetical protein